MKKEVQNTVAALALICKEIADMLNPNEVFVVARQSRLKAGGSAFTPNMPMS